MAVKLPRATEAVIHRQVCQYLVIKYPFAIFNSDGAGNKLTKTQAGMAKMLRSSRGYPDLFIAEPMGPYHGMYLELKRDRTPIYLKNGDLSADPHVREQAEMLAELRARGYFADFAVGTDQAKAMIDEYMAGISIPTRSEPVAVQRSALPKTKVGSGSPIYEI